MLSFVCSLFIRVIAVVLIFALLLVHRLFLGPSETVSNMLTMTLLETSALKFVPRLFMRESEVEAIKAATQLIEPDEKVNTSLIQIPKYVKDADPTESEGEAVEEIKDIEIISVSGNTYKGHLMIVRDPSRVFLGVTNENFSAAGMSISELCEKYDAVAGVNASGFLDENGRGNGGTPIGMVISEGKILRKSDGNTTIAAFDENHILHVGKFTNEEAEALKLRDGAGWGPALIINGKPAEGETNRTGLNPRTAIGQRSDGAVLLLVIDGRHPNSLGAGYPDLIEVMLKYGAVNACNLDGGTSSIMHYDGRRISSIENISVAREIPTAFLVRQEAE
ncbi:MAG: phosphodiester glycosidase family protein [Clostridia bacterium]|nr:phosphodiester glycosidase family protein [Clostridia bacterium]